jgi:hypothetical protein
LTEIHDFLEAKRYSEGTKSLNNIIQKELHRTIHHGQRNHQETNNSVSLAIQIVEKYEVMKIIHREDHQQL